MFDAQLVGEIASQVAKARAPVALGLFPCLDGCLLFFFTTGDIATLAQLTDFTQPQPLSPFESVSEADLKAMSASQKAELLV